MFLGRASSLKSVVTGSYSLSHTQCSSSSWIRLLIAVAAGALTGSGWCWRPWWQIGDMPGTITLSDGTSGSCYNSTFCEKTKMKSNLQPLVERVAWTWGSVYISLGMGQWPICAFDPMWALSSILRIIFTMTICRVLSNSDKNLSVCQKLSHQLMSPRVSSPH